MKKRAQSKKGHNLSGEMLKTIIQRVDKLEEEKADIGADIRDVWAEAKNNGFDVPTMKRLRKIMNTDAAERTEANAMLETYAHMVDINPFS